MNERFLKKIELNIFGKSVPDKGKGRFNANKKLLEMWQETSRDELRAKIKRGRYLLFWEVTKYYEVMGYETFKEFCSGTELGIDYTKASRLKGVFECFIVTLGMSEDNLLKRAQNWSQLSEMLPAVRDGKITKENIDKYFEKLGGKTVEDIRGIVRETRGKAEEDPNKCDHPIKLCKCSKCDMLFKKKPLKLDTGKKWQAILIKKID